MISLRYYQSLFLIALFLTSIGTAFGQSSSHDGTASAYYAIPTNANLEISGDITVEAWVRPAAPQTNIGNILMKGTTYGYGLGIMADGTVAWWSTSGQNGGPESTVSISQDGITWTHVAVSVEGGVATTFYINGSPVASNATGGSFQVSAGDLNIGAQSGGYNTFNGLIDEVRIWNDVRTAQEIVDNYNVSLAGNEANLRAYYRFNEGAGTTVFDEVTASAYTPSINSVAWSATDAGVFPPSSVAGNSGPGGVGSTDGTSDLQLWVKADAGTNTTSNGGALTSWSDQSGRGFNMTNETSPAYATDGPNGQPTIRFDYGESMQATGLTNSFTSNGFTIFTVAKWDGAGGAAGYVGFKSQKGSGSNGGVTFFLDDVNGTTNTFRVSSPSTGILGNNNWSATTTVPHIFSFTRSTSLLNAYDGGTQVITDLNEGAIFNSSGPWAIGNYYNDNNLYFDGDVAEFILYEGVLNSASRKIVENYLSAKYAIATTTDLYAGDDLGNGDYDFDVIGIGQESDGLDTEANSGGFILTNNGYLTDNGDYVMAGHDGTANSAITTDLPGGYTERWARDWYVDLTDVNTNNGQITLTFDFGDAGISLGSATSFGLITRSSTSGAYAEVATSSSIINGDQVSFTLDASSLVDGNYYTIANDNPPPNYALDFDGTNDHIRAGNNASLQFERTDAFTIEAWIKTPFGSGQMIAGNMLQGGTYQGYGLLMGAGGVDGIYFTLVNTAGTNDFEVYGGGNLYDNNWHHIAVTYDGSSAAAGVTLYVDGVSQSLTVNNDNLTGSIVNTNEFRIGARDNLTNTALGSPFQGQIDEVRVWNTERTVEQINAFKAVELNGSEPNLVGYWNFADGSGDDSVPDVSGTGNTGTMWNMDNATDYVVATNGVSPAGALDSTAPTPSITTSSATTDSPITIDIDFAEVVVNFDETDLSLTNAVLGAFTDVDGQNYTAEIYPIADGDVTVDIAGVAANDLTGNASNAATQFSIAAEPPMNALNIVDNGFLNANTSTLSFIPDDDVDDYTMEAWFKTSDVSVIQTIVGYNGDDVGSIEPNCQIIINTDGTLRFLNRNRGGSTFVDINGGSIQPDTWHHAAVAKTGTQYRLYLDGVEVASNLTATIPAIDPSNRTYFLVGVGWNNLAFQDGTELLGAVDEVRVWNDYRTPTEITDYLYTEIDPALEPNLQVYYTFNQDPGSGAAADMTGNSGTSGTLFGGADYVSSQALMPPVPSISLFTPTSGASGTTVTITGTDFNSTAANNKVFLDGVRVNPTGGNPSILTFDIPAQVTSVADISVLNTETGTQSNSLHAILGAFDRQFVVTNPTPYLPYYGTKADYFTGSFESPYDIVTGDFNLDGTLDLATVNYQFGNISVAIGVGDGTFNTPVNYSIGTASNTFYMEMGDFNGDGFIDIVASAYNPSPAIHILLGDGTGAFSTPTTSSFALNFSNPGDLSVADFNGDGYLDVVVGYVATHTSISVLLGTGTGEFSAPVDYAIGASEHALATGDFNNDGLADIAVLDDSSHNLTILLNNGAGGFNAPATYSSVGSNPMDNLVVGDFNEDGNLDLIGSRIFNMEIFTGAGDGSFTNSNFNFPGSYQPRNFEVGDFNGDGHLDIGTTRADVTTEVRIYTGDGAMNFTHVATVTTDDGATNLTHGDFNGDGRMDLAVAASGASDNINVLLGEAVPVPSAPTNLIAYSPNGTDITLEWDPTGVNLEDGFKVYRSADFAFTTEQEVTGLSLGADATTVTFAEDATRRFYIVAAYNVSGENRTTSEFATSEAFPGYAMSFDGNEYTISNESIGTLTNLTVSAWVYPTSFGSSKWVYFRGSTGTGGAEVYITSTGFAVYGENDGDYESASTAVPLTLNEWNHVAAVKTGALVQMYLNGVPSGTSGNMTGTPPDGIITIGARNENGTPDGFFTGQIDEVRIYQSNLSDFSDRFTPLNGNESNLVVYYPFDENAGSTVVDRSVNNNNGTISGATYVASDAGLQLYNTTSVTTSGFTANWEAIVEGADDLTIEWGTGGSFGNNTVLTGGAEDGSSFIVSTTLSVGTVYEYRIKATIGGIETAYSVPIEFMVDPGNALTFDGVEDYVTAANPDLTPPLSIDFWVKLDPSKTTNQMLVQFGAGGIYVGRYTEGRVLAFFDASSGNNSSADQSTTNLLDNQWHHVAATTNGTVTNLYIDGILEVTHNETATTGTTALHIGSNLGGASYMLGSIDEVRIWDKALSEVEIRTNMFETLSASETDLSAYYRFDETTGINLPDLAGTNDGTLTNMAGTEWTASEALAPTVYQATAVSTTQFTANWEAISFATQIDIQYSSDGFASDINTVNVTGGAETGSSYDVTGLSLSVGTKYEYRVAVTTGGTTSPYSAPVEFMLTPGYAYEFDGIDGDYINLGTILTASYTKEAWVRLKPQNANLYYNNVIGDDADASHTIFIPSQTGFDFKLSAGHNGTWDAVQDPNPMSLDTWTHIAVTYNASGGVMTLYKNGQQVDQATSVPAFTGSGNVHLGSFNLTSSLFGYLDEVRIWNDVRTSTEIQNNLYSTLVGNEDGLIAYYRLDNTSGTEVIDGSFSGNNGIMVGNIETSGAWAPSEAMAPTVYQATGVSKTQFTANWEAISFATQIDIQYSSDGFTSDINTVNVTGGAETGSSYDVTGLSLSVGTKYEYRVAVTTAGTTSPYSAPVEFMVAPGNAIQFTDDASDDDYITITNDPIFQLPGDFTIELWLNTTTTTNATLLEKGNANAEYSLQILNGRIVFNANTDWDYVSNSTVNDGVWHHIAFVYRDGATDDYTLYIDGVDDTFLGTIGSPNYGSGVVTIGGRIGNTGSAYFGVIDEVRIWDDERTLTEINDNLYEPITGSEAGLVAYYRFDETTGTTLPDLTGTNDGTLTNMAGTEWTASGALDKPVPTITSFTPTFGPAGTTVTITGTDFDATLANNKIFIGGHRVDPLSGNTTSLTFDVPFQVTSLADITVLNLSLGTQSKSVHSVSGTADRQFVVTNTSSYQPYYAAKDDYFTGSSQSPRDIITADFDLDGTLDIASVNSQFGTITVILGIGDGSFGEPVNYTISSASNTFHMDMGDFNGDGFIDIVTTAYNPSPALHIMLGDGTGAFSSPTTSSFALNFSGPGDISVADFNNDGNLDVVVGYVLTHTSISVLLGTGTGEFSAPVDYSIGASEHAVATGDFNGDGLADIAVLDDSSHNLNILLNNGSGGFNAPATYSSVGSNPLDNLVVGDFNEDGNLDLIGSRIFNMEIFTGAGDGSFSNSNYNFPDSYQPRYFNAGDYNGDGHLDIATTRADVTTEVRIYTGDGAMSFTHVATVTTDDGSERITNGDFNGDGMMDFAVTAGGTAENINVFISNEVPAPSAPTNLIAYSPNGTDITLQWDPTGVNLEEGFKAYRSADYNFTIEEEVTGLSIDPDASSVTFAEDASKRFYQVT